MITQPVISNPHKNRQSPTGMGVLATADSFAIENFLKPGSNHS